MLQYCPKCNSEQIICKHTEFGTKSNSLITRLLNMLKITTILPLKRGIPMGEYYFECKACGEKGVILFN